MRSMWSSASLSCFSWIYLIFYLIFICNDLKMTVFMELNCKYNCYNHRVTSRQDRRLVVCVNVTVIRIRALRGMMTSYRAVVASPIHTKCQ